MDSCHSTVCGRATHRFMSSSRPYLSFGRPDYTAEEIAAVTRVLQSGWVGMGPETASFEAELAAILGGGSVITVNSCTSALFLSLLVHGVGPGDEVVCPSFTWCSTANAALYLGARPVFADIDPATLCVSPETVRRVLTPRTKAIVVVHFGGQATDVRALRAALPTEIPIIEDAAHAFGATLPGGGAVGASGNTTCFSFYANKNLATGEGGAIVESDPVRAEHLRSLRQHALPVDAWKRFTHRDTILLSPQLSELGFKANYTDLQACLGRVQLRRQPAMSLRRLAIAQRYVERLSPLAEFVAPQQAITAPAHARHLFTVRVSVGCALGRDQLLRALRTRNIGATIHYAPLHQMPLYHRAGESAPLPVTEAVAQEILTLPISAAMDVADADYVCDQISELVR